MIKSAKKLIECGARLDITKVLEIFIVSLIVIINRLLAHLYIELLNLVMIQSLQLL